MRLLSLGVGSGLGRWPRSRSGWGEVILGRGDKLEPWGGDWGLGAARVLRATCVRFVGMAQTLCGEDASVLEMQNQLARCQWLWLHLGHVGVYRAVRDGQ